MKDYYEDDTLHYADEISKMTKEELALEIAKLESEERKLGHFKNND